MHDSPTTNQQNGVYGSAEQSAMRRPPTGASPARAGSAGRRDPQATSTAPSAPGRPESADNWIVQYHDAWSRLTLSSFYQDLESHSLTQSQFARWLLDRTSISMALLEAATRTSMLVAAQGVSELPLLRIAKEDATFLAEYTTLQGLDINSQFRLSHAAKRLVDLIEASTAPDASPVVAITAVWGYMLSSYQGWMLCKRRARNIPPHFDKIASFVSREDSIIQLIGTRQVLDRLIHSDCALHDVDKAGKTFEEIARRSNAVLDHTLYLGEGNHVPLCICGRKGHLPSQCTFKSHI